MMTATAISGHPVPVPNTPSAASSTARLPSTSLRVQIHAERIFESRRRKAHSRALREGSHGAITQRHADDGKTDDVVSGVAEKVEGIGLKRRRTGGETRHHLYGDHAGIDRQHRPQDATESVPRMGLSGLAAATRAHACSRFAKDGKFTTLI